MSEKMNGILIINKEVNMTSHDVVMIARKILQTKKIGHTGTLDPEVTGVLPLCIGNATKLVQILTDKKKEYICDVLLGVSTDTEDLTGKVIDKKEIKNISNEKIDKILKTFIGKIEQIPPMYSAVKINGKKLYEYARENKIIERPSRIVDIFEIERLSDIYNNEFKIRVVCGKGVYIRTLSTQIADSLNTIGCMKKLIRTKSGDFCIEDSYTLENVKNNKYKLINTKDLLNNYPKLVVRDYLVKLIYNGVTLDSRQIETTSPFVCYNEFGKILALYNPVDKNIYKPVIIFKED